MRYVSRFLLPAIALVLTLSSCWKKELPVPAPGPARIVLIGELIAGDSLHLRAGRSQAFDSQRDVAPEREMQISCGTAGDIRALNAYDDGLLYSLYTTLFSNPHIVQESSLYQVKASTPGLDPVEASVPVPGPFAATVAAAGEDRYNGDSMWRFTVAMSSLPPGSRYVVEVLRARAYVNAFFRYAGGVYDIRQEARLYDSLVRAGAQPDLLYDTSYSAQLTRQPFYADRSSDENTAPGSPRSYSWFFIRPDGQSVPAFSLFIPVAGSTEHYRYVLRLKSVSDDYYAYLKDYELSRLQPEEGIGDDVKPSSGGGNVKGGVGIVGGVYLRESRFVR